MPRIADALERESRTVDLEKGDFERLLARRERKQRNRQIRAGVVGIIVALAAAAFLLRLIHLEATPANPNPLKPIGAGEVLTGHRDLLAQDPDSGAVRKLVDFTGLPDHADQITGAAWSHDRTWVAFRAGGLWIADTLGGTPRQLTSDLGWSPWAWSPTTDQLVVVRGRDVTLIDAVTGDETDLGTTVGAEDSEGYAVHALSWSPDGTQIAYDGGTGAGSVYVIDVETGEHSELVAQPDGAGAIGGIDWSPDGSHLAITYEGASREALYIAKADGSGLRLVDRIAAHQWPVWHPGMSVRTAWSPDGMRLAYTNFSGSNPDRLELQVWTASVDGSAPSLVTSHCCVSDGGTPVWSPDGSQIAFANEYGGSQTLPIPDHDLVVNADGSGDPVPLDGFIYSSWAGGWYFCTCYG
jgi:Tol biopolymer transport system component